MRKYTFAIAIILACVILLTACGKEPDIICGNCAASVPGDSFFCPNCGTQFFHSTATTETTADATAGSTVEGSGPTPDHVPATQPEKDTATPPETTHVHNYSAATCLRPQTCACGATTGDLGEHIYDAYTCIYCGVVDHSRAYEYLCTIIIANGDYENRLYRIDVKEGDTTYTLVYDTVDECAYAGLGFETQGDFCAAFLWLDDYKCGVLLKDLRLEGQIIASSYQDGSPIFVTACTDGCEAELTELMQTCLPDILWWLDDYLYSNEYGFSIYDLGFTAFP